jgi:hypothetical protein
MLAHNLPESTTDLRIKFKCFEDSIYLSILDT